MPAKGKTGGSDYNINNTCLIGLNERTSTKILIIDTAKHFWSSFLVHAKYISKEIHVVNCNQWCNNQQTITFNYINYIKS